MGDVPATLPLALDRPAVAAEAPNGDASQSRVRQMAEQFEALLLTQMLRQMRQSMLSDEDDEKGLGKDAYTDSIDIELGTLLSHAGGLGLANELSNAMAKRLGLDQPRPESLSQPGGTIAASTWPLRAPARDDATIGTDSPAPLAPEASSDQLPGLTVPHGRVSSAYGWRADPFNGTPRFHNGIDVAQAYGQDVRAAAAGRVTFSGDRGSYGSTIIVEHPGGRRTLYAHLSALDVHEGDVVDAGQTIGKSGNSGRSTGPHLHFEVLDSGRPVDPTASS